jgi:hypothetical protein
VRIFVFMGLIDCGNFDLYLVTDEDAYVFWRLSPLGCSPCGFFGGYQRVWVEYIVAILRADFFLIFLYFLISLKSKINFQVINKK